MLGSWRLERVSRIAAWRGPPGRFHISSLIRVKWEVRPMDAPTIFRLVGLRYTLLWAQTRTRNGRIALFLLGLPVRRSHPPSDDCRRIRRGHAGGAIGPCGRGRAGGAGRVVCASPNRIRSYRVRHQHRLHRCRPATLRPQRWGAARRAPPDRHPGAGLDFRVGAAPGLFHRHVRVWRGWLLAGRRGGRAAADNGLPSGARAGHVDRMAFARKGGYRGPVRDADVRVSPARAS